MSYVLVKKGNVVPAGEDPDEYARKVQAMVEAANVDTTGSRKKLELRGTDLGETRYKQTQADARAEGQRLNLSGDELEEYVKMQMKKVTSAAGATTGDTSRKFRGRWGWKDAEGDEIELGEGEKPPTGAERAWFDDSEASQRALDEGGERHYDPRIERKTNVLLVIDRTERDRLRRKFASLDERDRTRASATQLTSFEPPDAQGAETAHVMPTSALGGKAGEAAPSEQHQMMFGSTKRNIKYHSAIKPLLQRLLTQDPENAANLLGMPHLIEYAKQLDHDENLELESDKDGNLFTGTRLNNRGKHLLDVLGDQAVRSVGGGDHRGVLSALGLSLAPGHEKHLPGEYSVGGPEEIALELANFDRELGDPSAALETQEAAHRRYAAQHGVPDDIMEDYSTMIHDLMESGASGEQARERALYELIEDGLIPETALQPHFTDREGKVHAEGAQDYGGSEFRPEGTLVAPTKDPGLIEAGLGEKEYAPTIWSGTYRDPVTGEEKPFIDTAEQEAEFPTVDPKFTMTESAKVAEGHAKRAREKKRAQNRADIEESLAMAPDANVPMWEQAMEGMSEEEKDQLRAMANLEPIRDERTAADFAAPAAGKPLPAETESTKRQKRRRVAPERGRPRRRVEYEDPEPMEGELPPESETPPPTGAQPLPFTDEEVWGEDDDPKRAMAVSGFSLGGQLLKAILDDMLK